MKKVPFYYRYVRSFFLRKRPLVCHFFATERCNLRCPYCGVYKSPRQEADWEATKRIIDRVAAMGVANFSITGGEPLLRREIYDIIDYASIRLPYVRITSNGTMPLKCYERLLNTRVDGISVSVDAVSRGESIHEKPIEKSFEVIDYLFRQRGTRRMNISTSFYGDNEDELAGLIDFCDRKWKGLKIFIQPVVTGRGNIRAEGKRVDPGVLFELSRAPNVSNTEFFNNVCREYCTDPNFVFKCLAGRLFFGVRPNGQFWACHDVPTPLNILDDGFFEEYRRLDFDKIADPVKCGSCIYSCYINLQRGFESVSPSLAVSHIKSFMGSFGER